MEFVILIDDQPYRRTSDVLTYKNKERAIEDAKFLKEKFPNSKVEVALMTFSDRIQV